MNNHSIIKILHEGALLLKHNFDSAALRFVEVNNRSYRLEEFSEFKRDLIEAGSKINMLFLEQALHLSSLQEMISDRKLLAVVFANGEQLTPILIQASSGKTLNAIAINEEKLQPMFLSSLATVDLYRNEENQVIAFVLYPFQNLVSEYWYEGDTQPETMSPVRRFLKLLGTEKKAILYIIFYSFVIGLTSLILPVGIQNTVQLISGGVFFSSIYVLIAAVIIGILFAGVLQIIQITLVEYLQRRLFTKAALEFAFRIPRIRMESLFRNYAPELVNRFFDVITLQKGLPKLLIDLVASAIQILFGLILISLYHPFFVFFSLLIVMILFAIFWNTGPAGLRSSISESKYKYRVAQWLEELARAMNSFKLAGNTDLPVKRTDNTVNNYLKYRSAHFKVLITQFSFMVIFKTAVTAALLILGTILVINREITLGQFVASEIVIIVILNAVEKVITYMDVVYDLLTAVDKIAQITDLPLEKVGGIDFPRLSGSGYSIRVKGLRYKYAGSSDYVLQDIDLEIKGGERVCIAGPGKSGKTTLTNLISGMHSDYDGVITINNYSLRDLDVRHLRDSIAKNISPEDIFDGTILENITLGSQSRTVEDAIEAIRRVRLEDEINGLPEGLSTHVVSGGKGFSSTFTHKLILARCLAKKPALIILNDFFTGIKREKLQLLESVIGPTNHCTTVVVSNDPLVMAACDRVIVMEEGKVMETGHFQELLKKGTISQYLD